MYNSQQLPLAKRLFERKSEFKHVGSPVCCTDDIMCFPKDLPETSMECPRVECISCKLQLPITGVK